MPMPLQQPEKELRFTRAGQALWFWLLAAVMASAAITLLAVWPYRPVNPDLPHPLWALLPLAAAAGAAKVAVHLTRHAYLILTPLGIEIFPFFRPQSGMRVVYWQEVALAEADPGRRRLTLHHDAARTSGVHLTLRPIPRERRDLLVAAVEARLTGGGNQADGGR